MNDNVRCMPNGTSVEVILEKAKAWNLTSVMIIGWDDTEQFRIGASNTKLSDLSWLIRNAEEWLSDTM